MDATILVRPNGVLSVSLEPSLKALAIAVGVAVLFALLRVLQRSRPVRVNGWHYLTPGPFVWFALIGAIGLSGVFTWVYLFVGSARADAAEQMAALYWLATGFLVVTLIAAYSVIAEEVRWTHDWFERRTIAFQRFSLSWHQLAMFGYEPLTGYFWIAGPDGQRLRFSPYYNGCKELLEKILDHLPTDMPPAVHAISAEDLIRMQPAMAAARRILR